MQVYELFQKTELSVSSNFPLVKCTSNKQNQLFTRVYRSTDWPVAHQR